MVIVLRNGFDKPCFEVEERTSFFEGGGEGGSVFEGEGGPYFEVGRKIIFWRGEEKDDHSLKGEEGRSFVDLSVAYSTHCIKSSCANTILSTDSEQHIWFSLK